MLSNEEWFDGLNFSLHSVYLMWAWNPRNENTMMHEQMPTVVSTTA